MRKVLIGISDLEKMTAAQRDESTKRITGLVLAVDLLKVENIFLRKKLAKKKERRLAFYENSHAPSSTNSLYNAEQSAARKDGAVAKKTEKDHSPEQTAYENPPARETKEKRLPGPPKGMWEHPTRARHQRRLR